LTNVTILIEKNALVTLDDEVHVHRVMITLLMMKHGCSKSDYSTAVDDEACMFSG